MKVGYEYKNCRNIIWDVQTTKLSGHDMSISEVGGWNLDIHHRYNFHEGLNFYISCLLIIVYTNIISNYYFINIITLILHFIYSLY